MGKQFCITKEQTFEIIIKKSRFLCNIKPISSKVQAQEYIEEMKMKYSDANHNCSAFIVDGQEYANDDGEPTRTAGLPMLNVLLQKQLNNIVVVVTRYFGGIKLGSGGLTRAYSHAVIETLNNTEIKELVNGVEVDIIFGHSEYAKVKSIINSYVINDLSEKFSNKITIHVVIAAEKYIDLKEEILYFNYLIEFSNIKEIKVVKLY